MSKAEQLQSIFGEFEDWIEEERKTSEKMVGRLPFQDPCCVRSHALKDFLKKFFQLCDDIQEIMTTPDA